MLNMDPQTWTFVLDNLTLGTTDADWAWRHAICERMWGFAAQELQRELNELVTPKGQH